MGPSQVELEKAKRQPPAPLARLEGAAERSQQQRGEEQHETVTACVRSEPHQPGVAGVSQRDPGSASAEAPHPAAPNQRD
jgi:hypothetical protein